MVHDLKRILISLGNFDSTLSIVSTLHTSWLTKIKCEKKLPTIWTMHEKNSNIK
jgi:hypothetical protein